LCQPALEGGIDGLDLGGFLRTKFAPAEGCYLAQVLPHMSARIGQVLLRFWDVLPRHRSFFEGL
jgi:hypothetical protein